MSRRNRNRPQAGNRSRRLARHLAELVVGLAVLGLTATFAHPVLFRHAGQAAAEAAEPGAPLPAALLESASTKNRCKRGSVALTFDGGPGSHTPQILEILRAYGVRATFFVTGENAAGRPDLIRAAVAGGHRIGSHGWERVHLADLDAVQIRDQLVRTQLAITVAGAPAPTQVRPPFGSVDSVVRKQAAALGLDIVRWSIDAKDWRGRASEDIAAAVLDKVAPGSVVMMQDASPHSENTAHALPEIIRGLRARGLCTTPAIAARRAGDRDRAVAVPPMKAE